MLSVIRASGARVAAFVCASLGFASGAAAVPIEYLITTGTVDIDVKLSGSTVGSVTGVALTGGFTIDVDALSLDALSVDISDEWIMLNQPVWGYDEIHVESANLSGDATFATLFRMGSPANYTVAAGSLTVVGSWGANDTSGTNPATSNNAISFGVASIGAVVNTVPLIAIDSVTINSVSGDDFGNPGENLTIVATYAISTATVVPEPGTGSLMALGLVGLAWRRRSGSRAKTTSRE